MSIVTLNPATEKKIQTYQTLDDAALEAKLKQSHAAFHTWRHSSFTKRTQLFLSLAKKLIDSKKMLSETMSIEMGKPLSQGLREIEKCAWLCEHYANHAQTYLKPQKIQTDMSEAWVSYQPLGVILGVMPWNFPFWQVLRFAVPTMMAGNAVVIKHASNCLESGEKIAHLFQEVGFEADVFSHLIINTDDVKKIIAHQAIKAVSFTGSNKGGRIIAQMAANELKKCVLELGGSDPYIVLADADLDQAAQCIVASRLNNAGQVCVAAKRVFVAQSIYSVLIDKIKQYMANYQLGDPLNPATKLGPLARQDLRNTLDAQVKTSIQQGAKCLVGGMPVAQVGFYYQATLLIDVKPGMPAFDEELFGPVIALSTFDTEEQAIKLANQSEYGLGAAIFSTDLDKAKKLAEYAIESGMCFINAQVSSDPRLPFGGIKHSGFGRELAQEGIKEFVNVKTIAVK
ncbi:MAG: succinate-semialdehyde dehydrogenase [Legionellaceae bacterium]|nr:succinate-semialdehyde dehydrogenase [Legionellaceae bacterium]HAF87814.1 succinate-semialdehyde dehydrogenase [Legionellales bacterium]HCA89853.1 succinate-semialdehyde dehydrogenase [Legionellales bacterium]|tara:strand:+ start:403 stop:1770 length:1368 start_codon:yes stop_codon:yes gene_type:complete